MVNNGTVSPNPLNSEQSPTGNGTGSPTTKTRTGVWPWVVLVLFSFVIVAERLHTYSETKERDLALYAVNAHQLRSGARLYNDVWEIKPPGVMWTYEAGECLFGYGDSELFGLGLTSALMTLVGIYLVGRAVGGPVSGIFSAALWTTVCSDLYFQANQPNTESFMNVCLVGVFLWFVIYKPAWPVVSGIPLGALLGLATLYKQFSLIDGILIAAVYLWAFGSVIERAKFVKTLLAGAATVAGLWLLVLWFLHVHEGLHGLFLIMGAVDHSYAGNPLTNLLQGMVLHRMWRPFMHFLTPLALLILAALLLAPRSGYGRYWALLAAYFAASYTSIVLPNKYWFHYYQLFLPVLCIGGGWAAETITATARARGFRQPKLIWLVCGVILVFLAHRVWIFEGLPIQEWSFRKYGAIFLNGRAIGEELETNLPPNSYGYQWGDEFEIYYYSGLKPASNLSSQVIIRQSELFPVNNPLFDFFTRRFRSDLTLHTPDVIVTDNNLPSGDENWTWLTSQYDLFPLHARQANFTLWVLHHSKLQEKLQRQAEGQPLPAGSQWQFPG